MKRRQQSRRTINLSNAATLDDALGGNAGRSAAIDEFARTLAEGNHNAPSTEPFIYHNVGLYKPTSDTGLSYFEGRHEAIDGGDDDDDVDLTSECSLQVNQTA